MTCIVNNTTELTGGHAAELSSMDTIIKERLGLNQHAASPGSFIPNEFSIGLYRLRRRFLMSQRAFHAKAATWSRETKVLAELY